MTPSPTSLHTGLLVKEVVRLLHRKDLQGYLDPHDSETLSRLMGQLEYARSCPRGEDNSTSPS
jgi:hypothetical protein